MFTLSVLILDIYLNGGGKSCKMLKVLNFGGVSMRSTVESEEFNPKLQK